MMNWMLTALLLSIVPPPCETAPVCRCVPFTEEDAAARADDIFTATVVSVRDLPSADSTVPAAREVRLRAQSAWKGMELPSPEVVVISGRTSCDIPFRPGERYLVYGRRTATGVLVTDGCSGTRRLTPGAENLDSLGEAKRFWLEIHPGARR